jgi:hypothetical protein
MRILSFIFLITILSTSLRAEFGGSHFSFTIETNKGELIKGYTYVYNSYFNQDSINDIIYLKRIFLPEDKAENLPFFKYRIEYNCPFFGNNSENGYKLYQLMGKIEIPLSSIKGIKINDSFEYGSFAEISNPLNISDTAWMKKKPIKKIEMIGYLCTYQVIVHQNSKKMGDILKQLKAKYNEYDPDNLPMDTNLNNELDKIFKKMKGCKAVVITECSC